MSGVTEVRPALAQEPAMRLTLFETLGVARSVALDKVLHVLTSPRVFRLPLLRRSFSGGVAYQGQIVPLLAEKNCGDLRKNRQPAFVLVCEAEYGLVAIPADRIVRITKNEEMRPEIISGSDSQSETCKISGRDYRLLDLNRVLEDPDFTVCGLKD